MKWIRTSWLLINNVISVPKGGAAALLGAARRRLPQDQGLELTFLHALGGRFLMGEVPLYLDTTPAGVYTW